MDKLNEYCFNLMERTIKDGAEGSGLTKEACVGLVNMMYGAREYEEYRTRLDKLLEGLNGIDIYKESEEDNGEKMGNKEE